MRLEKVLELAWGFMLNRGMVRSEDAEEGKKVLSQVFAAGFDEGRFDQSKRSKPVLQIKDGEVVGEFRNTSEAARHVKASRSMLYKVVTGKKKSCRGYQWRYK